MPIYDPFLKECGAIKLIRISHTPPMKMPHNQLINTWRPREICGHFEDIFKCVFLNENVSISIKFQLKFISMGPISSIEALVQIIVWRRQGDKPLFEPKVVSFQTRYLSFGVIEFTRNVFAFFYGNKCSL